VPAERPIVPSDRGMAASHGPPPRHLRDGRHGARHQHRAPGGRR